MHTVRIRLSPSRAECTSESHCRVTAMCLLGGQLVEAKLPSSCGSHMALDSGFGRVRNLTRPLGPDLQVHTGGQQLETRRRFARGFARLVLTRNSQYYHCRRPLAAVRHMDRMSSPAVPPSAFITVTST